jgi:MATE family multidrug resistance protein
LSIEESRVNEHPFLGAPHRTLIGLSVPVLFSLVAEPLTALVDTAFVSRLGAESLAALGIGATVLSSVFWIFNFLGIAGQTEVAKAMGRGESQEASRISTLAFMLAAMAGFSLIVLGLLATPWAVALMGAGGELREQAAAYMYVRCLGAPAVLVAITAFGVLRGLLDMRTPLWIAAAINFLNLCLDPVLIFGLGPISAMGVQGAAWASTISQWLGALWGFWIVVRRLGVARALRWREARYLLLIGGDLFVRTGLLNLYLVLATRTATLGGAEAGAAHQAIRQFWVFTALLLDAYAITAQSLTGYFLGASRRDLARRVAGVAFIWSLCTGGILGLLMLLGEELLLYLLVPVSAWSIFRPAWYVLASTQPINAVAFVTDGIHWGTGDFRFLRNVVIISTIFSLLGLWLIDTSQEDSLTWVWAVTALWIGIRGLFGLLRIWPGLGKAPLASRR